MPHKNFAHQLIFVLSSLCFSQTAFSVCELLLGEAKTEASLRLENQIIEERLRGFAHPEIPNAEQLSLAETPADKSAFRPRIELSPGITDPLLEKARVLNVVADFKPLSDAYRKDLSDVQVQALMADAREKADSAFGPETSVERERFYISRLLETLYDLSGEVVPATGINLRRMDPSRVPAPYRHVFNYVEELWPKLLKKAPATVRGSIIPTPYPFFIPAGRFQEGYYWDLYLAVRAMLATGRVEVAKMQVENLLHMVQRFGFVPNGWRDYYLSRSQPPFLSSIVREVYAHAGSKANNWLAQRALPLLVAEHRFWTRGKRYVDAIKLNRHYDDLDTPRPERHGNDRELLLGETYRDTRAAAESGRDFSATVNRRASHIAGPLLNAMLYKTEMDIRYFAELLHDSSLAKEYGAWAQTRRQAMNQYLWNDNLGAYVNYDFERRTQIPLLSAETAYALWVGIPDTAAKAKRGRKTLLTLESNGGLMASSVVNSTHQWDGFHSWAIDNVVAMEALEADGEFQSAADRLRNKRLDTLASIHERHGSLPESVDAKHRDRPHVDGTKYPVQEGFLWTNAELILELGKKYGPDIFVPLQ